MPINKNGIVLDTHIWYWFVSGAKEISPVEIKAIEEGAAAHKIFIPDITLWEVSMLFQKERLASTIPLSQWFSLALTFPGFHIVPIDARIAIESYLVMKDFHADPADRLIVATARVLDATLITRDDKIKEYAEKGHVRVL